MEVGVVAGLIALLSVVAVYFWVVRRSSQEQQNTEASQR
jgi:hypothetical protein